MSAAAPGLHARIAAAVDAGLPRPALTTTLADQFPPELIEEALQRLTSWSILSASDAAILWIPNSFGQLVSRLVPLLDRIVLPPHLLDGLDPGPIRCAASLVRPAGDDRDYRPGQGWRPVSGRGRSAAEAVLGCLAEGAERYCAQHHGNEPMRLGRAKDLTGEAIDTDSILLISPRQREQRERWNARHGAFNAVPGPISANAVLSWIAADAQLSTRVAWLPACCCLLGAQAPAGDGVLLADSNGCAVGTTLQDAAMRGFLELVERDAVSLWWYNRVGRPQIALDPLRSPLPFEMRRWEEERGRRLWLLDLEHDFQIPVVAAVSCDHSGGAPALGFGSGWSTEAAAERALGEVVQFQASVALIGSRVDRFGPSSVSGDALELLTWNRTASLSQAPHLRPTGVTRSPRDAQSSDWSDCKRLCRHRGLDLFVVNLSRAGIEIPAVRVVVPGLRHLCARFAAGRLFDVPVALGWIGRALSEEELNPVALMF